MMPRDSLTSSGKPTIRIHPSLWTHPSLKQDNAFFTGYLNWLNQA
jgi:hypothetical protein